MRPVERLATAAGLVGPLVGVAATLAAAATSPTFSWTASALSDLGAAGAAAPWLFNYGLVAGGLLTLPFAWAVWAAAAHPAQRLGAVSAALAFLALGLVGVFPLGTDLHVPVAVAFFLFVSLTTWIHGTGTVLAGAVRRGLVAVWLGIGHVLLWLGWVGAGFGGIAVPEIVGALLLYGWVLVEVRAMPFGPSGRAFDAVG